MPLGNNWISNDQAKAAVIALIALELASVAYFVGFSPRTVTGYAVGQVLTSVQNEPPVNYYFNADAATETHQGMPAFRLSLGQDVVMDGKARDPNGYGELSTSTCTWTGTAFSSTTSVAFNTCNSTDCNYTCTLTLSSSTPAGTYNVTSDITDTSAISELSQLIYIFEFDRETGGGGGSGSSGRGRDVFILKPAPSATPSPSIAPSPSPSPGINVTPSRSEFALAIAAPDFINKCEVKEIEVIVENNNPFRKSLLLEFEGRAFDLEMQPYEVRSFFHKIKAPKATGEMTFEMDGTLYSNGKVAASKQKRIKLLWHGLDVCITPREASEFDLLAGRRSVSRVDLEIATDLAYSTLEIEAHKGSAMAFADLYDTKDGYYTASFNAFEKGEYDFKVLARKGFETLQQKFEKAQIG